MSNKLSTQNTFYSRRDLSCSGATPPLGVSAGCSGSAGRRTRFHVFIIASVIHLSSEDLLRTDKLGELNAALHTELDSRRVAVAPNCSADAASSEADGTKHKLRILHLPFRQTVYNLRPREGRCEGSDCAFCNETYFISALPSPP